MTLIVNSEQQIKVSTLTQFKFEPHSKPRTLKQKDIAVNTMLMQCLLC